MTDSNFQSNGGTYKNYEDKTLFVKRFFLMCPFCSSKKVRRSGNIVKNMQCADCDMKFTHGQAKVPLIN